MKFVILNEVKDLRLPFTIPSNTPGVQSTTHVHREMGGTSPQSSVTHRALAFVLSVALAFLSVIPFSGICFCRRFVVALAFLSVIPLRGICFCCPRPKSKSLLSLLSEFGRTNSPTIRRNRSSPAHCSRASVFHRDVGRISQSHAPAKCA